MMVALQTNQRLPSTKLHFFWLLLTSFTISQCNAVLFPLACITLENIPVIGVFFADLICFEDEGLTTLSPTAAPQWSQIGQTIPGEGENDNAGAGTSVTISGDGLTLAVGAFQNDGLGTNSGHVRIYFYDSSSDLWVLNAELDAEAIADNFGVSVSLSHKGTVIAIGADRNDGGTGTIFSAGHVQVYEYNSGSDTWTQIGSDLDGDVIGDRSGAAIALSGDGSVIAIGAPFSDVGGSAAGQVRIYENTGGSFTVKGSDIVGASAGENSGISVAINYAGDVVAVGANRNDDVDSNTGQVRIFSYTTDWNQIGSSLNGRVANDNAGSSVALNAIGDIVAYGSPGNDFSGSNAGNVLVFKYSGTEWEQLGSALRGVVANDESGTSVSLDALGNIVAIGSPFNDDTAVGAGEVRVFWYDATDTGDWVQLGIDANGLVEDDNFGTSLALSAGASFTDTSIVMAVGAPSSDANGTNSGAVQVFEFTGDRPNIICLYDDDALCCPFDDDALCYSTDDFLND